MNKQNRETLKRLAAENVGKLMQSCYDTIYGKECEHDSLCMGDVRDLIVFYRLVLCGQFAKARRYNFDTFTREYVDDRVWEMLHVS